MSLEKKTICEVLFYPNEKPLCKLRKNAPVCRQAGPLPDSIDAITDRDRQGVDIWRSYSFRSASTSI